MSNGAKKLTISLPILLVIAVVILVVSFAFDRMSEPNSQNNVDRNSDEPFFAFSLKDYNGNTVNYSEFSGKPTVINAWAAWCPFCKKELPDFVTAQKEFGDRVVIIAINREESLETAKFYSDQLGVTEDLVFLLDPNDSFYRSIQGFSMPETLFVNSNGEIIHHKRGIMELPEIREKILDIL